MIDELIDSLDVKSSNNIATKEIKDFKRVVIKLIDKFNSYIKLKTKKMILKRKILKKIYIEKKGIKKKDTAKEHIEKVSAKKNSVEHHANNKPTTSADIRSYIIDKQKLIKKHIKVY